MWDPQQVKLGRLQGDPNPAVPRFENHLTGSPVGLDTDVVDWTRSVAGWPMLMNNQIGNCTIAGVGHMVQVFGAYNGRELIMTDPEAQANYSKFGYVPGDPTTDKGAYEQDVLQYWQEAGLRIGGQLDRLKGFASVNPQNPDHVRKAADLYGGLYNGANMPLTAQKQGVWDAPKGSLTGDAKPGSWGGHCFTAQRFESPDNLDNLITIITWGTKQLVTWRWWNAYVVETHLLNHATWSLSGRDPAGVNIQTLDQAMNEFAA